MSTQIVISPENIDMMAIDLERYREEWNGIDAKLTSHIAFDPNGKTLSGAVQCSGRAEEIKKAMQILLDETCTYYKAASAAYKKADTE